MVKKWYAFISQTGLELRTLSDKLNRVPDRVITNCLSDMSRTVQSWVSHNRVHLVTLPCKPDVEDYDSLNLSQDSVITLHGFLRIIPPETCLQYNIYNGHPGLITKYPDLKGLNPQDLAYRAGYTTIGSVVHKVTPVVDSGEIIVEESTTIEPRSVSEEYYEALRGTSLKAWLRFFHEHLNW